MNKMESSQKIQMMQNEKISKLVLKFAIPTIVAMLVNAIYNAVDAMFVSWLGVQESGAISVVFPVFMLILGIGLTFGTGAGSYISRLLGEGKYQRADGVASTAFYGGIIITAVFTIMAMMFLEPLLKFAGASQSILPHAMSYSRIIILGSVFPITSRILNNMIRAEGNVKFNSIAVLLGAVLNIILDPIFIFEFGMGIRGAAYATILSQAITTVILMLYFIKGKSVLTLKLSNVVFSNKIIGEILKIGLPTFMFQLLMSMALGMINRSAGAYDGDAAVAAMGIANRVFVIAMYVIFGFAKGFQPIAGFNYGAGNYKRLNQAIIFSIKCTSLFAFIASFVMIMFSHSIVGWFTSDLMVIEIGARALFALSIAFPLFGVQMIFSSLFLAMGKAKEGGFLSLGRQGVFFLPMILILPKLLGLTGVIYAQTGADLLTSICSMIMGIKLMRSMQEKERVTC